MRNNNAAILSKNAPEIIHVLKCKNYYLYYTSPLADENGNRN